MLPMPQIELEVKNLEEGLRMAKVGAFADEGTREQKDENLQLLLRLINELESKRGGI